MYVVRSFSCLVFACWTVMAEVWTNQDVLSAVFPIFPLSRILGIIPYSSGFGFSNTWLAYSLIFHVLLLVLSIMHKTTMMNSHSNYNIYAMLKDFQTVLNYITVIAQLLRITFKRKTLATILRTIAEIDSFWVVYTKIYGKFYYIFGLCLLWIPSCIFIFLNDAVPAADKFDSLYNELILSVFYSITMLLCSLLEILRCHLVSLTNQLRPEKFTLFTLVETHNTVIRLAGALNDFFSWQILWICIRCSVTFVLDIFTLLKVVGSSPISDSFVQLTLATSHIFWDFLVLFLLSASCSRTSEEVDVFNSQLFKVIRSHSSLYKNEKLRMYTVIRENHEFNACGYFTVGYPLITSVIGATTTYVVILVQFLFDSGSSSSALTSAPENITVATPT